jgi:cellobiose phosphorylase
MAADVYAVSPHEGRGGWTWYTGAAGWMYRVGIEYILGLKKSGEKLIIDPCIPKDWPQYNMQYKYNKTFYHITVENPNCVNRGVKQIKVDGKVIEGNGFTLIDDGNVHKVYVTLG